jgi:hypothetical protein
MGVWQEIARGAAAESPLWRDALLPSGERELEAVFSPLGEPSFAVGIETIYEGYLLHYGRPRLFQPHDHDAALLLGDYLYAHGLVRIAEFRNVVAVGDLAELISLSAQLRGDGGGADGPAWAATAAVLGEGRLDAAREAFRKTGETRTLLELAHRAAGEERVANALAAHERRSG